MMTTMHTSVKKWVRTIPVIGTLLLVLSLAACKPGGGKSLERMAEHVSSELSLSGQQKAMLEDILQTAKAEREARKGQRDEMKAFIKAQVTADALNEGAILARMEAHQQAHQKLMETLLPKLNSLHATLTDEQKQQLGELLAKHEKRWGKHHRHD